MPGTFKFFSDSGLTSAITTETPVDTSISYSGSSGNVDNVVYFGSPTAGQVFQAASNPGTDQIVVEVYAATGTGLPEQPDTFIKVALSQVGLDTATQTVDIGTTVLGGVANAIPIWFRENISNGVAVTGYYANVKLRTSAGAETTA